MKTPGKSFTDREQELRAAEQNISTLESQQAAEIVRLEALAGRLTSQLRALRTEVAKPEFAGSKDAQVSALLERLEGLNAPRASFDEPREQVLALRQEAVVSRNRMAEKVRQLIRGHAEELSHFEQRLAEQDNQLQELQVRVELERARRDREREKEAQREREAQRRTAEETAVTRRTELEVPASAAATVPPPRSQPPAPPKPVPVAERPSRVRMQASVDLESESNFFQGFSTNLSEGGLFVATVQMLPRGTQVDLHFTLPGGKKVDARGVVRWTREVNDRTPDIFPGVGVQFVDLPQDAASAIRGFVSEREPLFFAD